MKGQIGTMCWAVVCWSGLCDVAYEDSCGRVSVATVHVQGADAAGIIIS